MIKSSEEISLLFSSGDRIHTPYLTFIVGSRAKKAIREEEQRGPEGRVAFIAGKKLGNAVWRNRAKRRMRSLCRDLGGPWSGKDVVFLAKSRVADASYSKVFDTCRDVLDRSDVLGKRGDESGT